MQQIEHLVLLMLENRSFDNVLGWLAQNGPALRAVPAGSSPIYDGLNTGTYSNPFTDVHGTRIIPVEQGTTSAHQPLRVPRLDPYEAYAHVIGQLFGDGTGHVPQLALGTPATMQGFARNFDAAFETWGEIGEVMGAYTPAQLPVLNGLARQYAVSDRWFSSVPTQTNPNRAFFHTGTSLGREVNGPLATDVFDTPTIWNALPADVGWGIYFHDIWKAGKCFTEFAFPHIDSAKSMARQAEITRIATFYEKAAAGTLPAFSFIEPAWGYGKGLPDMFVGKQGNDYHPPTWVGPGEAFVNQIYEALTSNAAAWSKTMFIITFDEHGGTYDHVDPGWGAVQPDGHNGPDGFTFDRYGVRVPTIVVSPWIPAGTVFRAPAESPHPFDHCSMIATLLKWQGVDPAAAGLGARVAVAPTFESVLGETSRTDIPRFTIPADYAGQGALSSISLKPAGVTDEAAPQGPVEMVDIIGCFERCRDVADVEACLKKIKTPTS